MGRSGDLATHGREGARVGFTEVPGVCSSSNASTAPAVGGATAASPTTRRDAAAHSPSQGPCWPLVKGRKGMVD